MPVASYKVSVDRSLLKTMHTLGRLNKIAPDFSFDELKSEHIEKFVKSLLEKEGDG